MHADGYEADAEQLAGKAAQFEPLVGRLSAIHRQLADALSADGVCWGGDDVGHSFAAAHAGPADDTVADLLTLPDRLGSVGTRLSASATTYQGMETSTVEQLNAAEQ
jgi:hypothetical protein